jgi:hypothetical protein
MPEPDDRSQSEGAALSPPPEREPGSDSGRGTGRGRFRREPEADRPTGSSPRVGLLEQRPGPSETGERAEVGARELAPESDAIAVPEVATPLLEEV